jgi:WD40 repeat protein
MKKFMQVGAVVCLLGSAAFGAPTEKYLHVRVTNTSDKEVVSVNVPLSLAEKVVPAINHGKLSQGKVTIDEGEMKDVDVRAILEAVKNSPDGEYVTIQGKDQDVRVAKSKGNLVVHVTDKSKAKEKGGSKVDVIIPMSVVNALMPSDKHEIDLVAAIHALSNSGEKLMVTVHDSDDDVKVWVDAESGSNEPSAKE